MASSDFSDLFNPKWVQRPTTRAKGWMVRRGTLPIYPNHYLLNYPGAFNLRLSLQLSVLTTKIPIACVGVLTNFGPCPRVFVSCPCTVSWLGRVAPLAGTTLCRFSDDGTPRALHCLRAYQLPKNGECPLWQLPLNANVAGWRPGPLPWVPAPNALPTRPMAPRAPHHAGHPCPLRYPGPPWALSLPRPTSPVPGVPTKPVVFTRFLVATQFQNLSTSRDPKDSKPNS